MTRQQKQRQMCSTATSAAFGDTYGAPGTKLDIDIEELDRKGNALMLNKFPKPTLEDVTRLAPLILEIINAPIALTNAQMSALNRRHRYNGKRPFLFQVYMLMTSESSGQTLDVSESQDAIVRQSLQIKAVKSWSGICNVTIFTSPYPEFTDPTTCERVRQNFSCEFNCHYCSNSPNIPRSYVLNEPAVLRAARNKFDAVNQIHDRMETLYITGNSSLNKIELNILGGTFNSYPNPYREEFIRDSIYALNIYGSPKPYRDRKSLNEEKKINETTECRLVLLAVEIRPDSVTPDELRFLRYLSVTRIQLGIQHLDDDILNKVNRKCSTERTIQALEMLKYTGYKIDSHYMPNLPLSSPEKDRNMLVNKVIGLNSPIKRNAIAKRTWAQYLYGSKCDTEHWEHYDVSCPELQTDQLKIYPLAVVIYSEVSEWFKRGEYIPYDERYLNEILIEFKSMIFPFLRINRVVRDFFQGNIFSKSGSNLGMRDTLKRHMDKINLTCACIRCRESKLKEIDINNIITVIRKYRASRGDEYFISIESNDKNILYGFCRLRFNDDCNNPVFPEINGHAIIRELHVYSTVTRLGEKGSVQHRGIGSKLMKKAEEITKQYGYTNKIAVIASIGSRTFYEKIGYRLDQNVGEYMLKYL